MNVRRHELCESCQGSGAAPGKTPVTGSLNVTLICVSALTVPAVGVTLATAGGVVSAPKLAETQKEMTNAKTINRDMAAIVTNLPQM